MLDNYRKVVSGTASKQLLSLLLSLVPVSASILLAHIQEHWQTRPYKLLRASSTAEPGNAGPVS